jgi:cytidine deaminase/DNA-directed RNA polymerase subunit RPC12/RpoP
MPGSRGPRWSSGRCPRCGGDLMRLIVLHGGRHDQCPSCGFARVIEPVSPHPPIPALDEAESTSLQDTVHLLVYAQAVLQTIHQVRGCGRCRERLALLRDRIDDLEQVHAAYASHPEQCDDQRLDAFFDLLTERLQGIGHPCSTCRRRMEDITWDLFVRLLLAAKEQEES